MDQQSLHLCASCEEFVQAIMDGVGVLTPEGEKALQEQGWKPGVFTEEDQQILMETLQENPSTGLDH